MQLSKFTDYGLRVLMQLTVEPGRRVSVREISETFSISEHHVAKVASQLTRGGFIVSGRGRAGGLALAKLDADINIGTVVRYLSGDVPVAECFATGSSGCKAMPQCGLRGPLAEAQAAFFGVLEKYTLADVVSNKALLRELLA
jgi:Rrf2 family nitric oxide-sensitive transcriptional repressor